MWILLGIIIGVILSEGGWLVYKIGLVLRNFVKYLEKIKNNYNKWELIILNLSN